MLPQAAISPWVQRRRVRKWIWVAGAAGQALATAAMALLAWLAEGVTAGIGVHLGAAALAWVAALCVFATIREPAETPSPLATEGPGWIARSLHDDPAHPHVTSMI